MCKVLKEIVHYLDSLCRSKNKMAVHFKVLILKFKKIFSDKLFTFYIILENVFILYVSNEKFKNKFQNKIRHQGPTNSLYFF